MRLPLNLAARLLSVSRDLDYSLPSSYCAPACPNCRNDTASFNLTTSCQPDSRFLADCGYCQQCIITYAIETQSEVSNGYQGLLESALNLCIDTPASTVVLNWASQASRLSLAGDIITGKKTTTTTGGSSAATPASIPATQTGSTSSAITAAVVTPTSTFASQQDLTITTQLNRSWIVGPVIGSILGISTVAIVIFLTRRKQRREALKMSMTVEKDNTTIEEEDWGDSTQGKAQLHAKSVEPRELETNEVYELAAVEPVGSELSTPREGTMQSVEDWPLPLTPLRAIFAMAEKRDERAGSDHSPKHDTFYHS